MNQVASCARSSAALLNLGLLGRGVGSGFVFDHVRAQDLPSAGRDVEHGGGVLAQAMVAIDVHRRNQHLDQIGGSSKRNLSIIAESALVQGNRVSDSSLRRFRHMVAPPDAQSSVIQNTNMFSASHTPAEISTAISATASHWSMDIGGSRTFSAQRERRC